jgi:hypothetical protein
MNTRISDWLGSKDVLLASIGLTADVLGNSTSYGPLVLKVGILGVAVSALSLGWQRWRRAQGARRQAERFTALREPDKEAAMFAEVKGTNAGSVVGKVIEIWPHDSLDTMLPLDELGIDPKDVVFSSPDPGNFDEIIKRCGGLKTFPPPNQDKYGIRQLPLGTKDDQNYIIRFFKTDWNTWMSVRTVIEKNPNLRWELSHVVPERNQLPQSMSLQFLVRFNNGDVLVLRRGAGLASEGNSWSFSGEEQISKEDFEATGVSAAAYLFRRAFTRRSSGTVGRTQILRAESGWMTAPKLSLRIASGASFWKRTRGSFKPLEPIN